MNIYKKISDFFLKDYLEATDDIFVCAKIRLSFKVNLLVSFVMILFSYAFLKNTPLLGMFMLAVVMINLSVPFYLKYKRDYLLATKISFSSSLAVIWLAHIALDTTNLLAVGIFYVLFAISAGFIINLKWTLRIFAVSIANMVIIAGLHYYQIDMFRSSGLIAVFSNFENDGFKDLFFVSRIAMVFGVIYAIVSEYIRGREHIAKKMTQLFEDQKDLNNELEIAKLQYQHLIEGVDDMIYQLNEEGDFEFVNPAVTKVTGYSKAEILEQDFRSKIKEEKGVGHLDLHLKLIEEKRTTAYQEFPIYTKDGDKKWVGRKTNLFYNEHGEFLNSLCIARDITEEREIKQELIQAKEKAIEATKAKAQFLSSMSHEIRTPMNAVIALTHLMLEENPRNDQKDHLNTLKFSAENLLGLINDILDFSKIEAGKVELINKPFNLKQIIQTLQHGLGSTAKEKGIYFDIQVDETLPNLMIGDSLRLTQVLNNLVGNAIKFTETGGVTLSIQKIFGNTSSCSIQFKVIDTGIGIAADKLDTIFEEFAQAANEDARKGTGLGLAITKELLRLQNSTIKVESKVGKGSTFEFILEFGQVQGKTRINNQQFKKPISIKNYPHGLHGVRLLLVEDNLINQKVAMNFLHKWGLQVDVAFNGKMALDYVEKYDYHIILMDLQMPVMNGIDATKAIRKMGGVYTKLPIIALTASAVLDVRDEAMEAGLNDFLTKPFLPQTLYKTIAEYTPEIEIVKQAS